MQTNDEKTTSSSLPLVRKDTNLHRNRKNRKNKNMALFGQRTRRGRCPVEHGDNTAITVIKNHSQGIHEVEWHQCDLRKELCAYGGIGSHILSKTDLFLCKSNENQNHFVFLILGYFSPYEVLKRAH